MRAREWEAVLFDLDGTLADSIGLILRCYRHTMETHGHTPDEDVWIRSLGQPLRTQFRAFAASDAELDAMVDTYVRFQVTVHDEMVRPFPDAATVIEQLTRRGVPLGIVTGKRRVMTLRTLRVCGFEGRFEAIVTPDDVPRPKPDPGHVGAALKSLGIRVPGRALMVGDAPVDIISGKGAGVRTAAALWGPFPRAAIEETQPDHYLDTLEDVLTIEA